MAQKLESTPGRENVEYVTMDLCEAFRSFSKKFFPGAKIIADKFHVLRLLSPSIIKQRKQIMGTYADRKMRRLLLCNSKRLDYFDRQDLYRFLESYPTLKELYMWKEEIYKLYRIKGYRRAELSLNTTLLAMKLSQLPEIRRLSKTLLKWKKEILNYFEMPLTNGRVEGFNNKASLVRKRGFGYRNPNNYRLRLLSACG